jgi:hypothetical protein
LIEVVVAVVLAHVFLLLSCWFIFLLSRFGDIHVYVYTPRSMATQMSKKRKVRVTSESFVFVSPFFSGPRALPKKKRVFWLLLLGYSLLK